MDKTENKEPKSKEPTPDIINAEFLLSLPKWDGEQVESLPMVAFAGRSNVGKSSLLNTLTNRKQLARVSNTPGRTQHLNFFKVEMRCGEERRSVIFCDLPGYGYAKAPGSVRKKWTPMMQSLLEKADNLRGLLVLLDLRHTPTGQDVDFLELLEEAGIPVLPVATKSDKVPVTKRRKHLKDIADTTAIDPQDIRLYSSMTRNGRDVLLDDIWWLCSPEESEELPTEDTQDSEE